MRKLLIAFLILLGIYFILSQSTELEIIVATLRQGNFTTLFVALGLMILWITAIAAAYASIYRIMGMREKIGHLILVILSANFVNIVAPLGGMSGVAVFIADAQKRNLPTGRITVASALFVLVDYVAFLCVLSVGWIVLLRRNDLDWTRVSASLIVVLIASGILLLLILGAKSQHKLETVLTFTTQKINWILRPIYQKDYLSVARSRDFARDMVEGVQFLKPKLHALWEPIIFTILAKALLICVFGLIFVAFNVPITPGTLIGGWSIGYLFLIVSPTPSGIGIVEGVLTLALKSFYVPIEAATIIVIAYRGYTFWLPLLAGLFSIRRLAIKTS